MLQNASLLAIVAVHTAENEPSEVGGDWGFGKRSKGKQHKSMAHGDKSRQLPNEPSIPAPEVL